jgi:YgiT-type zinc finger domain-containing protein
MDPRDTRMNKIRCTSCGSQDFETRRIEYLYSHGGEYLLVPDTPVEVCQSCGTMFYEAKVLKEIERRFFAIQGHQEEPERYLRIPTSAYA